MTDINHILFLFYFIQNYNKIIKSFIIQSSFISKLYKDTFQNLIIENTFNYLATSFGEHPLISIHPLLNTPQEVKTKAMYINACTGS